MLLFLNLWKHNFFQFNCEFISCALSIWKWYRNFMQLSSPSILLVFSVNGNLCFQLSLYACCNFFFVFPESIKYFLYTGICIAKHTSFHFILFPYFSTFTFSSANRCELGHSHFLMCVVEEGWDVIQWGKRASCLRPWDSWRALLWFFCLMW